MKKQPYLLIGLTSFLFILFLTNSLLDILNLDWSYLLQDIEKLEKLIFLIFVFSLSMSFFFVLFWRVMEEISRRKMQINLKRLLAGKEVVSFADPDLDASFKSLSGKLNLLTEAVQKAENQSLVKEEAIIEKERKRIARDLHDTVSQELFAANMILSGVSQMADQLSKEDLHNQIQAVEAMLTDAQNDMRVLLLHLRPTELENKTLQEGLQMILKELTDKSNIHVVYKDMVKKVPKRIENNLFRIAQEFISNTLKHAKASQIEVYLYQNSQEIQLKMLDNGVGYDLNASTDEMSYGLKNIQERVDEMAGTVQFLSAKGKGTSIDVRVPILRGEDNVE